MAQQKLLYEVSIIRPLIIFLLVVLHCFAPTVGAWPAPEGIGAISLYYWLCQLIQGFRIETIALIAGYVFCFQSIVLGRKYSFGNFVWKKFKRLIVPCLVFSGLYYFMFIYEQATFSFTDFLLTILSGADHLWFLPMLFWCFMFIWVIDRYQISSWWLFVVLCVASIYPLPVYIPLGIHRLPHFLFYVYLGYILYKYKDYIISRWLKWRNIAVLWLLYIAIVVVYVMFILPNVDNSEQVSWSLKFLWYGLKGVSNLLSSCSGIMALYLTVMMFVNSPSYQPAQWVLELSKVCYGVYIFHQFILMWLYYHTNSPIYLGSWLLPWVGLVISLVGAYLLTRLFLRTRAGRWLLG